ncbi:MAG: hypothetical protein ABW185_30355, partial [Sedimenticola sp.]
AMGDSSHREVVNLSKEEYMDLIGEVRTLQNQLSETKSQLRQSRDWSRNDSREQSPVGRYSRSSQDRSKNAARMIDRSRERDIPEAESAVYSTPRAVVGRDKSSDDNYRRPLPDAPISGRNRASVSDRRRISSDGDYGQYEYRDERQDGRRQRQCAPEDVQPPRKLKQPATYDGRSSWRDYLVHFEMVAELNQWNGPTRAMELAVSLRGTAQGVLSDLRPEQRKDYRSLVLALSSRFEPDNQAELHRAQLKNRVRNRGEALTELAQDIKRLTRMSYPQANPEIREQLAKEGFLDALCDPDLEWAVHQGKPNTAEEAVRLALEYEAFQDGRKRRVGVKLNKPTVRAQCEVTASSSSQEGMLNEIMKRINQLENQRSTGPAPTSEVRGRLNEGRRKCSYCKRDGHTVDICFTKERDERNHNRGKARTTDNRGMSAMMGSADKKQGNYQ